MQDISTEKGEKKLAAFRSKKFPMSSVVILLQGQAQKRAFLFFAIPWKNIWGNGYDKQISSGREKVH